MAMWKKSEEEHTPYNESSSTPLSPVQQLKERALVGHTITVQGDISGEEDLLVHGKVEGKIDLKGNNVTVGRDGQIKADVSAKIISIEGLVQGNLIGQEQVIVRKSGKVEGNITAPRVSLEDGCKFSGKVNMKDKKPSRRARPAQLSQPEVAKPQAAAVSTAG